jgi:hypothetical protein
LLHCSEFFASQNPKVGTTFTSRIWFKKISDMHLFDEGWTEMKDMSHRYKLGADQGFGDSKVKGRERNAMNSKLRL